MKSAPIIVLCPGYQMVPADFLPLAAAIQDHGYNVFTFDIESSSARRYSTLGYSERTELTAGIAAISRRADVEDVRFGLWGTDLGGYVALSVAESDPRIRAVAVEALYDDPRDFAGILIQRQGPASLPLLGNFAEKGFSWVHRKDEKIPRLSENLNRLAGMPKLFLVSSEDTRLSQSTEEMFRHSPDPKQMEMLAHGDYTTLVDDEKRAYENLLVSFFLLHLPLQPPQQKN